MSRVTGRHVWTQTERYALHLWYVGCNTQLFARHLGVTRGALHQKAKAMGLARTRQVPVGVTRHRIGR